MNRSDTLSSTRDIGPQFPDAATGDGDAAGKEFWENTWHALPTIRLYEGPVFEQHPVLARYLSKTGGGSAIEIGCVPGNFMVYLNKEFGYRVDGLDYSDQLDYVRANLECNGIFDSNLFHLNFFEFAPDWRYDLVFSAGFVEHFEDHELVVKRHADLAKPGGLVVIFLPNLTHLHKWLTWIFARDLLRVHRLQLMEKRVLRRTLEEAGLQILHCDYHRTFRPPYRLPRAMDLVSRGVQKILSICRLDNIGNRFASPYLISVSMKVK
jgi:2-polyprenyl-3-methyl-5-hydroxy-6-metoxy-1,4-benzoquinol methylase